MVIVLWGESKGGEMSSDMGFMFYYAEANLREIPGLGSKYHQIIQSFDYQIIKLSGYLFTRSKKNRLTTGKTVYHFSCIA